MSTVRGSKRSPRNGRTSAIRLRVYRPHTTRDTPRTRPPERAGDPLDALTDWGTVARIYDLEHPAARGDELRFWDEQARETSAAGPVLELATGSGRIAIGLARKGHDVTGLELSNGMIARAEGRAARLPPDVQGRLRFVLGDMSDFTLPDRSFGLIFVAYNSFWLLQTPARQARCLECVQAHLAPGGRFVLDVFPPNEDDYTGETGITQYLSMAYRGQTVVRVKDYAWDARRRLGVSDVRYYGGRRGDARRRLIAEFRYALRLAPPAAVRALLTRAGFAVRETYGSYDKEPLGAESPRAIFVCGVA
jgi:ubiquinone/menaquinone biosynthesis C-methylase UbiE